MAPTAPATRANQRFTPPPSPGTDEEATTRKRTRFFEAYDRDCPKLSFRELCRQQKIGESKGRYWKGQRERIGAIVLRSTRKVSKKLGRKSKVTKAMAQMLVDPSRNPVRDQHYDAQIEYHNLPVKQRQLQRKLKELVKARRFKMAFVKKQVSAKNKEERVAYGTEHIGKTIEDFWSCITFTDEAHHDPAAQPVGYILRQEGGNRRYADENIQERPEMKGTAFHIAAWINWWGKAPKLEFYNDEEDTEEQPPMPVKPRRRPTTETQEEYKGRVKEWEATKPHKVEKRVKGNHMT